MSKEFFNTISRKSLDADIVIEQPDETVYLCFLDSARLREIPDANPANMEQLPVWSIERIAVEYSGETKKYIRKYPSGSKYFEFAVSEIENYNFEFQK